MLLGVFVICSLKFSNFQPYCATAMGVDIEVIKEGDGKLTELTFHDVIIRAAVI